MTLNLTKHFSTKQTPQQMPIPGQDQVMNSAGGFAFGVDRWTRLDRFLILGSEGGSYYTSERSLTIDNAQAVLECIEQDGVRVVKRIAEISDAGRAPKNEPAIFALAMCAKLGDERTRKAAREELTKTCRIGTHLFHFTRDLEAFGGWGRGTRRAVASWYKNMPLEKLAYQVIKYKSRDGWSHRDLLRLSHPKTSDEDRNAIFRWIVRGDWRMTETAPEGAGSLIWAHERALLTEDKRELLRLIRKHRLPREALPTHWLNDADVWAVLLEEMPMTAMIRNLGTMTRLGLLQDMNDATKLVADRLADRDYLRRARIHPIAVLAALMTYRAGHGMRGKHTWQPVARLVDALDGAFYRTFDNVQPTNKRWLLALDVSGSMECGTLFGVPGLTPRVASAALALVTATVEPHHGFVAFTSNGWTHGSAQENSWGSAISSLAISPRMRLDTVLEKVSRLPMGGTDCALPMLYAKEQEIAVDVFVILTDSETWAGQIHPCQALDAYRRASGIPAKLIVVGMMSNAFSIANPKDAGMLDVVGFDTSVPMLMSDFACA